MPINWRRFEVLLPTRLNDGQPVDPASLADAVLEIVSRFGAASYEPQTIEGHWRHAGATYRDDLVKLVVDIADTPQNRRWMKAFKVRWRSRLQQVELWMVSYRIDVE